MTRRFQSLLVSPVVLGVDDTRSVRLWIGVQRHTPSSRLVTPADECLLLLTYRHPKNSMHNLIEEHLDTTKCASSQSPSLLKIVRDKVNIQ
jgi:hypothetical protein